MIEELELLVEKKKELDEIRSTLNGTVEEALRKLEPLREQMKDVIANMNAFHDAQEAYIALSQRTYSILADNMESIEREIVQTQNLLDEGNRLSQSALPIHLEPLGERMRNNQKQKMTEKTKDEPCANPMHTKDEKATTGLLEPSEELTRFLDEIKAVEPAPETCAESEDKALADEKKAVSTFWEDLEQASFYKILQGMTGAAVQIVIPNETAVKHESLCREVQDETVEVLVTSADGTFTSCEMSAVLVDRHGGRYELTDVFTEADTARLMALAKEQAQKQTELSEDFSDAEQEVDRLSLEDLEDLSN